MIQWLALFHMEKMQDFYPSWSSEKKAGPISKQDDSGKVKNVHIFQDPMNGDVS